MTTSRISEKTKRTPVPINGVDTPKLLANINAVGSHPDFAQFQNSARGAAGSPVRTAEAQCIAISAQVASTNTPRQRATLGCGQRFGRSTEENNESRLNGSIAPIKGNSTVAVRTRSPNDAHAAWGAFS